MAEGQFSGTKGAYIYRTDTGTGYVIRRDQTLATVNGTDLQPATPTNQGGGRLPQGLKPRGVHWQGVLNGRIVRKFVICGSPIAALYEAPGSVPLTIDNVEGFTTGRRGESQSFFRLAADPVPPGG